MHRLGFVLLLLTGMVACSDGPKEGAAPDDDSKGLTFESFNNRFPEGKLPFSISDTGLANRRDTATLRRADFIGLLPDSIKQSVFGAGKVRYQPMARITGKDENYLVVKASAGERMAALLYIFNKQQAFKAVFPLLVADNDPSTTQSGSIDKQGALIRSVSKKLPNDGTADGRDVFVYTEETNDFTIIQTDPLEDPKDVLNPLDTFAKQHPLAGDYVKNGRNFVSVRDARSPSELNFFIHFEKGEGDDKCSGELKGTALLTSSRTAVYRQGGDPCVLELQFSGNSVTLRETEGCGSHRGVKCAFDGSFTRKKAVSPKSSSAKKAKK